MKDLLSVLNSNTGAIQGISTVVLVIVTAYYAKQTKRTVDHMKVSEETQTRPRIAVFLRQKDSNLSFIDLVVANYGNGLAKNVTFKVTGKNFVLDKARPERTIKSFRIIVNGIKTFGPGQEYQAWLLSVIGRVDELQDKPTHILTTYENADGSKKYSDKYRLDFKSLPEYQLGKSVPYSVATNTEKIAKHLEKIERKLK